MSNPVTHGLLARLRRPPQRRSHIRAFAAAVAVMGLSVAMWAVSGFEYFYLSVGLGITGAGGLVLVGLSEISPADDHHRGRVVALRVGAIAVLAGSLAAAVGCAIVYERFTLVLLAAWAIFVVGLPVGEALGFERGSRGPQIPTEGTDSEERLRRIHERNRDRR